VPDSGPAPEMVMQLRRIITDFIAGHTLLLLTLLSGFVVVAIGVALLVRAWPLLSTYGVKAVLLGNTWAPSSGLFGMKPFIIGTAWVTGLSAILAVPICLLAAIYLAEYAGPRMRAVIKPLIDLLSGIPSVVYGVWGVLVVVPFIADKLGPYAAAHWQRIPLLGTEFTTGFSILAGAVVLAIMIAPVIITIADEVLRAVPHEVREASYALGATRFETITRVVVRKALPGLIAAVVLGVSRALGETMAVLMVVGNVPFTPKSVFDPAYPLPALIANNYGEMLSIPLYDSALLGAALLLLVVVLAFNLLARVVLNHAIRRAA
jgi:phosphate transport system permease protein